MTAARRPALLLALLGVLIALAATLRVDEVQAVSYTSCALSDREAQPAGGAPTFNLTLRRSRVTCGTAKRVAAAFHRCRATPAASLCRKVLLDHWRCTGMRESSTALLFYGTLSCSYGTRRVRSSYQQNTA